MEDRQIIDLYWQRNEAAIAETGRKYGCYCNSIAMNLLENREDAEECVNDTWYQAWVRIPPARPKCLSVWLGCIVRRIAINLWHKNHAKKRDCALEILLSELEDCIPAPDTSMQAVQESALTQSIQKWLATLSAQERAVFIRRYWHGTSINALAAQLGLPAGRLTQQLFRLRQKLRTHLEQEGITV